MFFAQTQDLKPQAFRNAYDIPRRSLLDQLTRMRTNLLKTHKFILGQDEGKDSRGVLGMQGVAFFMSASRYKHRQLLAMLTIHSFLR